MRSVIKRVYILSVVCSSYEQRYTTHVQKVPLQIREFFDSTGHLSMSNGLLTYDDRIVIPADMRGEVLECIHTGHQGITKCRKRANLSVWWPGISKEIKAKVESCQFCQENQPSQRKEPLMTTDLPDRPWQVSTDLFELASQKYLVVMDYYSRFIEILSLVETTSQVFIQKLKSVFARWGIPEELISDNGTQFKSLHFDEFKAKYGFKHTISSPHHPQANGTAESGVQIAKRILKQEEPFLALMAYRATPTPATGKTPSELITGRLIRTTLPTLTKNLEPKLPNHTAIKRADIKAKRGYKESFDKRNDAKELPKLQHGGWVRANLDNEKQWTTEAKVVREDQSSRSYIIDTGGRRLRRNRRHLRKVPTPTCSDTSGDISQIPDINSEPTLNVVHVEDTDVPESSNASPDASDQNAIPEQRTLSGRLVRKPIRYREDI